jgi:hypothetical protein
MTTSPVPWPRGKRGGNSPDGSPMPIYLVRWPDLSAALVKANSEDHLLDILDEVANPEGCSWSVYRGPLFLDFALPARVELKEGPSPIRREDIEVHGISELAEGGLLEVTIPGTDTGAEMSEAIEKKAFPHIFKVRHGRGREGTEAELRKAVDAEIQTLVRASWRTEHVKRRDDPESRIAAVMDAPPRLVKQWLEAAKPAGPKPTTPQGSKRRRKR